MRFRTLLLGITLASGMFAQNSQPRAFVEQFYKWYLPAPNWSRALKARRQDLSPQLAKALEDDAAAQAKCKEIVGIDFDPFLYTQDPSGHYQIGQVTQTNEGYRVEILPGKVIAEVRKTDHWFFNNFYYPDGSDLIKILNAKETCGDPK